jgi:protein-disulfide isomerase
MQKNSGLVPGEISSNALKLLTILLAGSILLVPPSVWPQRAQPTNCVTGTLNAPIRLDVFSDFQCPACRTFYLDVITQVVAEYGSTGKICILYHELPLNAHQYSRKAASYSLAAQRLGRKQWLAVMDRLYRAQPLWAVDGDIDRALEGAVSAEDMARIRKIAAEPSIEDAIIRAIALGDKREVGSTPTVFVTVDKKVQKVERVMPYQVWKDYLDKVIQ